MPSAPPGWKSTGKCGHKSSSKRWNARSTSTVWLCPAGGPSCWKTSATSSPTSFTAPAGQESTPPRPFWSGWNASPPGAITLSSYRTRCGGANYAGDTDQYLLALAQVNNAFAARADNVCRVVCGLPVYYKGGEKL